MLFCVLLQQDIHALTGRHTTQMRISKGSVHRRRAPSKRRIRPLSTPTPSAPRIPGRTFPAPHPPASFAGFENASENGGRAHFSGKKKLAGTLLLLPSPLTFTPRTLIPLPLSIPLLRSFAGLKTALRMAVERTSPEERSEPHPLPPPHCYPLTLTSNLHLPPPPLPASPVSKRQYAWRSSALPLKREASRRFGPALPPRFRARRSSIWRCGLLTRCG